MASYFKIYEEELDNICLHEEVKTLDFLKEKNVPLGIITNGPTDHQTKLKQLQLNNWIPSRNMLISQATGFQNQKRDFQLAEKEFHMLPEETLYVGDNYDNDVLGAKVLTGKRFGSTIENAKLNRLQFAISRFLL